MAKITYTTIASNAYTNIYDIINNRIYIIDPRRKESTDNTIRKFVYDIDPLDLDLGYNLAPYIILHLPTISSENQSLDTKKQFIKWTMKLIVRTKREGGSNTGIDRGRTDLLDITDDLLQTLKAKAVKTTLALLNVHKLTIEQTDYGIININNLIMYESEFEITFDTRMAVSV